MIPLKFSSLLLLICNCYSISAFNHPYKIQNRVYDGSMSSMSSMSSSNVRAASTTNNQTRPGYESPFELAITPIQPPNDSEPDCVIQLMEYEFKNSYYEPYIGPYTPDPKCAGKRITKAVLTWKGYSIGTQFDRISAVWLDGIEILRTSTAEPTRQGITWEFSVDATRYSSLLESNRTVTVSLNNVMNEIYTGSFLINLKLEIYLEKGYPSKKSVFQRPADNILAISRFGSDKEPWYTMKKNETVSFPLPQIPKNVQRATLEVFITGHGKEEFFQFNTPDDFAVEKGLPRYGPFRELQVSLNGIPAGVGWPFPVIFTGGVSPTLHRPVSGIGSFSTDPILFELSQFVGDLIRKPSSIIDLLVTPSDEFWLVTGNLHLWYDGNSSNENDGMISSNDLQFPIAPTVRTTFKDDIYTFKTHANRAYHQRGHIDQSQGRIRVETSRKMKFDHDLQVYNSTDKQPFDFTVTIVTETKFKYFPDNVRSLEESSESKELFREAYENKWRFHGVTITDVYPDNGFLINADVTGEVVNRYFRGGRLLKELNLEQHNLGQFGRRPNHPSIADGSSKGRVSYFNKLEPKEQCYRRSVETEHGWITKNSESKECH